MTDYLVPLRSDPTRLIFLHECPCRLIEIAPLDYEWAGTKVPELHDELLRMTRGGVELDKVMDQIAVEWGGL